MAKNARWILVGVAFLGACKSTPADGNAAASASAAASARPTYAPPSGPRLAIVAGQGVGAVRIGANVGTIERLMEAPCDEKTADRCRYIGRAVEFELGPDGNTARIRAHRPGRDAGGGKIYGVFNGAIPPDVQFGMLPSAVQQTIGPPERTEAGDQGAFPGTIAQHHYKGMVLEYEKMPNGNPVLSGVRIPN